MTDEKTTENRPANGNNFVKPVDEIRLSQAAYARHRGVSAQRVNFLVREGRIKLDADGLIDPDAADEALGPTQAELANPELTAARARLLHIRAARMQLDNENDLGELLDRDDCEATIERMGEIMGAVIDRFEDRTPELYEIARQGNVKTLRAAIKQAAHNLRQELADTLLSGIEEGKQP